MSHDLSHFVPMLAGIPTGKLLTELYDLAKDEIKTTIAFKPELKGIQSLLDALDSLVPEIDRLNQELDLPKEEVGDLIKIMAHGKVLVAECLQVEKLDFVSKNKHAKKLRKLRESLEKYFQRNMQGQIARDVKEVLVLVNLLINRIMQPSTDTAASTSIGVGVGAYGVGGGLRGICRPPELKVDPVGLEIPLRKLNKRVLQDATPIVVLSAAGGSGKTTLAIAFCHDQDVKGKFGENIFFITVSKSPSLLRVVKRLFQHRGSEMPDFESEEDAAIPLAFLLNQMEQEPALLVLDDVWPGSETVLEGLDKFRKQNHQILVTSRSEIPRFGTAYKLPTLNAADAMALFKQLAILPNSHEPAKDLVDKIVEACKGSPLVISVIGKSVCGKPAAEWRRRAEECAKASSILGNSEVLNRLQSSVDALDDKPELKKCYMDLGAFPEDHRIPATTLIDISAELHGLDENNTISNLQELGRRSLLDILITRKYANEDYISYNEHFVSLHDLLRELAILQSTKVPIKRRERIFMDIHGKRYPEWCSEQMEPFNCAKLLSINTDETFASCWIDIQASEVQALVLNLHSNSYALPGFIAKMKKLKVLILTNYGYIASELSGFRFLGSKSNLRRMNLYRISLPSRAFTSIKLKNLRKITLAMCLIGQAFANSTKFRLSESLPNIVELAIDCCSDLTAFPVGICQLTELTTLSITNCHYLKALPEEIGNLEKLEVLMLASCIKLSALPTSISNLQLLRSLDMSECSDVTELPTDIGNLGNLKKLHMAGCSKINKLPDSIKNLKHLEDVTCDEETIGLWDPFLPQLKPPRIWVDKEESLSWLGPLW